MNEKLRLVLLSFLMLFVELALIRWAGSNVVYLSYFSNFVLLGSFLGIGLGFLRANKPRNLFPWAPTALAALVAFIFFFPVEIRRTGYDLIFFGTDLNPSGPPRTLVLTFVFIAAAIVMAFIAEGVARTFALFEPLEAYRLDIMGSICGIVGFSILSFLRAPPLAWGVVAALLFAVLYAPKIRIHQVAALVILVTMLGIETFDSSNTWSPYYKISTKDTVARGLMGEELPDEPETLQIDVNGVPHQTHIQASKNPLYTTVYEQFSAENLDEVLIIGSGGGNDVAVALDRGAKHIDAVEIDPRLYELGRDGHPDRPYDDPRVDVHINDGRAFLERTDTKYDLIVLALPDSITLVSGQAALRLESYLFTQEAIDTARDHLKPSGVFAMYNFYRTNWLVDRYAKTLDQSFGYPPCQAAIQSGESRSMQLGVLVTSVDEQALVCEHRWDESAAANVEPASDDYPFPYLRSRSLPYFYLVTMAFILITSLLAVRGVGGPFRPMLQYTDLFFMGAAFLLLETKNVVQFALLFGTTWFVNALVFTGVLLSVYLAVETAKRVRFKRPQLLYVALLVTLAIAWIIPQSALLSLSAIPRFTAAVAIAFAPIFIANLVFAERFRGVGSSTTAFGANLLGAMVGGLIEYVSLVTGYRFLLLVIAVLYGLAFVFGRNFLGASGSAVVVPSAEPLAHAGGPRGSA